MPVNPTYPGVYIQEVPSGVRTIVGVATSVCAFVDRFRRGPRDEAVEIFSFADFEREFGGLDAGSEGSYGIQQFFLNGGTDAWVVRVGVAGVAPNTFVTASRILPAGANSAFRMTAGRRIRGAAALDPGTWANALRFEIDYDTTLLPNAGIDPDNVLAQNELFNLTIVETEVRDGRTSVRQTESYRNLTMRPGARTNAIETVNAASRLVQLDRTGLAPADPLVAPFNGVRPDPTGTVGIVPPGVIPASPFPFDLTLDPDGALGPIAPIAIAAVNVTYTGPATLVNIRAAVEAAIRGASNNAAVNATAQLTAQAAPLLREASVQVVNGALRVVLGRNGTPFDSAATLTFAGANATAVGLAGAGVVVGPQQYGPTVAGTDSAALTAAALRGVRAAKTGLFALEDVSLFNILCIPAAAELAPANAAAMRAVYAEAETYCEERRAFLVVDVDRATNTREAMQTWMNDNATLRHRNAAVYFPRVQIPDPLNQNRLRSAGPSGTMAGLYAQTDANRGVWKAPAGTDSRLRNVQDLDYVLTDPENGTLNPLAANCLRSFPVFGPLSWGARTLDGADQQASEWKYLPVRRFALFLEESLFRGTKWVVFEPNDEPLWAQIRLNIGAFLQGLFRQGAFQGRTPREAYFVKCDGETTTQADINLGIVNIVVGFAPLKPAEFVILRIQQMAGQIPT